MEKKISESSTLQYSKLDVQKAYEEGLQKAGEYYYNSMLKLQKHMEEYDHVSSAKISQLKDQLYTLKLSIANKNKDFINDNISNMIDMNSVVAQIDQQVPCTLQADLLQKCLIKKMNEQNILQCHPIHQLYKKCINNLNKEEK